MIGKALAAAPVATATATVIFGLTLHEVGFVVSAFATVLTLGVNHWYRRQHKKLKEQKHE